MHLVDFIYNKFITIHGHVTNKFCCYVLLLLAFGQLYKCGL